MQGQTAYAGVSRICHSSATKTSCSRSTLEPMQERTRSSSAEAGVAGLGPLADLGASRWRDADWLPAGPAARGLPGSPQRTQVLHQWALAPDQRAAGLMFQPLDGNPRHGVLALFVDRGELHGAIEIVERQGRWLVMPDDLRARTLAVAAMAHAGGLSGLGSSLVGTPDRRFIFFNTQGEGGTATLVERRRDAATAIT